MRTATSTSASRTGLSRQPVTEPEAARSSVSASWWAVSKMAGTGRSRQMVSTASMPSGLPVLRFGEDEVRRVDAGRLHESLPVGDGDDVMAQSGQGLGKKLAGVLLVFGHQQSSTAA